MGLWIEIKYYDMLRLQGTRLCSLDRGGACRRAGVQACVGVCRVKQW